MRKIFTLLTMCLLASAAWAVDITFVPGTDGEPITGKAFTIEKDGVKIEVSNGTITDSQYRVFKNQTMTVTSSIGAITEIKLECTANDDAQYGPGCFTATPVDYSYSGKIGTWAGQSAQVVFTASRNQVRMTKITVTVGQAGLAAPSIKPGSDTYYDAIDVTITCVTPNAKIYYTTDGSTPTTSSTQYTAPFRLNSNTTVKAISALDGEVSDVVEAVYEFATATKVANIAAYSAVADETVVQFTNPVNVIAQNGKYLYVKDNTGCGLFYGTTDQTYSLGSVIPANFVGKKTTYNGEPELTDLSGFLAASGTVDMTPDVFTTAMVNHNNWAHYVYFESATIDPEAKTLTDAVGTAPVYFSMGVTASQITAGKEYEVWAIVGAYKPADGDVVYQLLPIRVKPKGTGPGMGLGNLGDVADGTDVTIDRDAIVLGQSGKYLYLKDDTGYGLAYGDCGKSYTWGDKIPAGYSGSKTTWDGEPELQSLAGFESPIGNIGGLDELNKTAETITPGQVSHDTWGHYVKLSQVIIDPSAKTFTANGVSCAYYDRFGVALPSDLSKPYDVYGIVASYGKNTVYQLLPTFVNAPIDTTDVANIPELYQLNEGSAGHFTTPLTTIYQNGQNLYVKDVDGNYSLVYGSVEYNDFKNGDYINDAVASWTTYSGNKQIKPGTDTFVYSGHGTAVEPEIMPVEEISQDMLHWFLGFEDVNVIVREEDGKTNYYLVDETGELWLYDKFDVGIADLDMTKPHYIEGFLTIYRGALELYPTLIDGGEPDCGTKGDVNNDGEINLADVNALIDIILSGKSVDECTKWRCDVAEDNELGLADVNGLIAMILK